MKVLLTRCGYRCDLCLAYKDNILKNDQTKLLSDKWHDIFGFRIPADQIFCEGCLTTKDSELILIDKSCPVRPCVLSKGLENCAYCEQFICRKLEERIVEVEELERKMKRKLTKEEYKVAVEPYENKKRLTSLRLG